MTWFYIVQWFSNCGPWTSNIRISWELVRNAYSNLTPHLLNQRLRRWDLATWVLINPPDDYDSRQSSRTTGLAPCYYDCVLFTAEANQFFQTDLVLPVTLGLAITSRIYLMGYFQLVAVAVWKSSVKDSEAVTVSGRKSSIVIGDVCCGYRTVACSPLWPLPSRIWSKRLLNLCRM